MPRFTTRVELHDAQSEDYDLLHAYMEIQSFSRTITGSDGTEYQMPPAEYNLIGDHTIEEVRVKAQWAANLTGKTHEILVTEGTRCWIGLKEVVRQRARR